MTTATLEQSETLPAKRTLYEIGQDMQALESLLYEVGGDVTEAEADAAITAWMAENATALAKKADGYLCLMSELELRAEARRAEAARMAKLAAAESNAAYRLRDRLHQFMLEHGIQKLETEHFRAAVQKNGGKVPVLIDSGVEPGDLPQAYQRVKYEIDFDKDAIREALEAGEQLDFARLGERGTSLRVR